MTVAVYGCIAAVAAEIAQEGIAKTRKNTQQNYNFRGIDEVMNALAPLLAKHKLVILPRAISRTSVERETKLGNALFYVTVEMEFDFVAVVDGSIHTVKTFGEAMDSADKATNKAMSAAYKYAAFQTFCIPTEGDNDADAQSHDVVATPVKRPAFVPVEKPVSQPIRSEWDDNGSDLAVDIPNGFALIDDYKPDGDFHKFRWMSIDYKTRLGNIAAQAIDAFKARVPVKLHSKKLPYLDKVDVLGDANG